MKHYGDITKIDGHKVPLVDIVTGGSPCQDLSVAGKRAGLDGERSGLFMEQVRIVKEMRDESRQLCMQGANEYIRPRYLVWENVPGAFSSNKGEDFRCVLEEIAKVAEENATIPRLAEGERWANAGLILGNGYSIAWRLHDLQYFGCPQRRKRICVLADFNGDTAGKILFELQRETANGDTEQTVTDTGNEPRSEIHTISKGVSGDIEQSGETGKTVTRPVEEDTCPSSYTLKVRGGVEIDSKGRRAGKGALIQEELSGTLGVSQDQTLITGCLNPWDVQSKHIQPTDGKAEALYSGECRGGGGESYVMSTPSFYPQMKAESQCYREDDISNTLVNGTNPGFHNGIIDRRPREDQPILLANNQNMAEVSQKGVCNTLPAAMGMGGGYVPMIAYGVDQQGGKGGANYTEDVAPTLASDSHGTPHGVCYGLDRASFNQGKNALYDFSVEEETAQTLVAKGPGGVLAKQ